MSGGAEGDRPVLRIVKGGPTPEEVAALVAVIASMGATEPPASRPVSAWADPRRGLRTPHRPGLGAWRASGLPR